jgi:hypothetical protein
MRYSSILQRFVGRLLRPTGRRPHSFLTVHLGNPIPSPALFEKIGTWFRAEVRDCAAQIGVPWVVVRVGDRTIDVVGPLLDRAAGTGRSQVVAVGVAQEFQYVTSGVKVWRASRGVPRFAFGKAERRATCFYFYLWGVRSSARHSSRYARTSRIRSRFGSMATRPGQSRLELAERAAYPLPATLSPWGRPRVQEHLNIDDRRRPGELVRGGLGGRHDDRIVVLRLAD